MPSHCRSGAMVQRDTTQRLFLPQSDIEPRSKNGELDGNPQMCRREDRGNSPSDPVEVDSRCCDQSARDLPEKFSHSDSSLVLRAGLACRKGGSPSDDGHCLGLLPSRACSPRAPSWQRHTQSRGPTALLLLPQQKSTTLSRSPSRSTSELPGQTCPALPCPARLFLAESCQKLTLA